MGKNDSYRYFYMSSLNIIILFCLFLFTYFYLNKTNNTIIVSNELPNTSNNLSNSLSNPYLPPMQENPYFNRMPINQPTQDIPQDWRQIGILTRYSGKETILPLMGRPLIINRNRWQYYTMSDRHNSLRLPVIKNGKSCTSDNGCSDLFNGDQVYVEGYNDVFKVTIYENSNPRYIPYI